MKGFTSRVVFATLLVAASGVASAAICVTFVLCPAQSANLTLTAASFTVFSDRESEAFDAGNPIVIAAEPTTTFLVGSGLLGLGLIGRRLRRKAQK